MQKILFLVCVLALNLVNGDPIWKVFCSGGPLFRGRIDPIVNPGAISGHSHRVAGGSRFSAATLTMTPLEVFNDLYASSCTTCSLRTVDMSAYWHPDLYYMWPNGTFSMVPNGGLTVYYLSRSGSGDQARPNWQPIPKGLRILAGNPYRRNFSGSLEDRAINYACLNYNGGGPPEMYEFPTANYQCPNGLRAQVWFPMCWDGVNLDSPDHKSHMAYPTGVGNGNCPASHPVRIPGIFMEALYFVDKFPHGTGTNPFVWSCGDPTGYGLHADFLSGWDEEVMRQALANPACDNDNPEMAFGNNVKACPPLAPYVQDPVPGEGQCALEEPIPLTEDLGIAHPIPALPGCNPITYGPAQAVPCSLDPINAPRKDVTKRFHLRSKLNGMLVTAPDAPESNLIANVTRKSLNEVFSVIPIDATWSAIMSETYGNFWSANGQNERIKANRDVPSDWEHFRFETRGADVAIISRRNNRYVTVQSDLTIAPSSTTVAGDAQLFTLEQPDGGHVGVPPATATSTSTRSTTSSSSSTSTSSRSSTSSSGTSSSTSTSSTSTSTSSRSTTSSTSTSSRSTTSSTSTSSRSTTSSTSSRSTSTSSRSTTSSTSSAPSTSSGGTTSSSASATNPTVTQPEESNQSTGATNPVTEGEDFAAAGAKNVFSFFLLAALLIIIQ